MTMSVSFGGNPKPPMEQAPVVAFDLEQGTVKPREHKETRDMDISSGASLGIDDEVEDFVDEVPEVQDCPSTTTTTDKEFSSSSKNETKNPLDAKAKLLREALACLYVLQTVGTTVLVYFLADGAHQADLQAKEEGEAPPFDGSFYEVHPVVFTLLVAAFFSLVGGLAYAYHSILIRQLKILDQSAKESNAVVSSLFPARFRDRLLEKSVTNPVQSCEDDALTQPMSSSQSNLAYMPNKAHLKNFLQQGGSCNANKPIADLFLSCTVLFADVAGFTAWSTEREPTQVFMLLESLYAAFDRLAKRGKVFKVETIGDCYVAVTGLPDPQQDHATRMLRFARHMMQKTLTVVKQLESSLGPDTGDLRLRIGINSGPVTAGVLRGERARFQLFGDTVNAASRMETTGVKNRIQLSQATAELLIKAGKEHWITPREDQVAAKGLGDMQCYWGLLRNAVANEGSVGGLSRSKSSSASLDNLKSDGWGAGDNEDNLILAMPPMSRSAKNKRLIDWNVEILTQQLKRLVAQRDPKVAKTQPLANPNTLLQKRGDTPYEEVIEAIELPKFDTGSSNFRDSSLVELGPDVVPQLRALVTQIANGYRDNPFHNFEHASHVTMNVSKLLNRVVAPEGVDYDRDSLDVGMDIHNYTYGITSDALSQFAIIFSALIHDVDHPGVSNGQLAEENPELGAKYKNKSVAEQNSVDIAWDLLMRPEYKALQQCIFSTEAELQRFRSTIVNSVLATDIFEKDGKAFRNQRWEKAFHSDNSGEKVLTCEKRNLMATIVIEHIIQASDVSHTMQHWKIYQKWNERLFRELYLAYDEGRSANDPSVGWYKGELWFFDNYVCPLAKKLAECKVFGVSSDEGLINALANRKEWAEKGEQVVREMVDRYKKRKELEIGGLTNDEINSFTPSDLEYIMKKLIAKGRSNGTKRVDAAKGQNDAAQAWMDALEVYERAPASLEIRDRSIVFPVYSGVQAWLKGGKIQSDENGHFEQNLARKFVRESKRNRRDIHYLRAMGMLCEVTANAGNYETALNLLETLKSEYDPQAHSLNLEKVYGVDRAATAIGMAAMWYDELGKTQEALSVCDFVATTLLPQLDGTNTLGMFELLVPILKVLKQNGETKKCYDLFNDYVHEAFLKNHGPDAFTPTKSLHKPMIWLFAMLHDPDNFSEFDEAVEWLAEGENGTPNAFLDNLVIRTSWGPSDMAAELCLLVAKRLWQRNQWGDAELCKTIAEKGLRLVRIADAKIKDVNGKVLLQFANKIHAPVMAELERFAMTVGVHSEAPPRTEQTPGVKVNLPPSYLVVPCDAADFVGSSE